MNDFVEETDWHWLAGIFEGEGSAGMRRAKCRHSGSVTRSYLYASISQRETTMLAEVLRIAKTGSIYNANRKDGGILFAWYCGCAQARAFLNKLLPFIRSEHKRKQVRDALALDGEMRSAGTLARRAALKKGSKKRWEDYRAEISRAKTEERVRLQ